MNLNKIMIVSGLRGPRSRIVFFLLFLAYGLWPMASSIYSQTELGSEDDLTVLGIDGTVPDPDVEIRGFSIFGSTNVLTHISTAPGNVIINGVLEVSSNIYTVGFSSANKYYGDGSSLTGISGDNLGNHTATAVLQMGAYGVNTSSNITAARYQINGSTMVAILPGIDSVAYGAYAGASNIAGGNYNIFAGNYSGQSNTTGYNNSFLGSTAGQSNTTGFNNSFLGNGAGRLNTTGAENSFMGSTAGQSNTTGVRNAFLGYAAGYSNTTASDNSFLGNGAGYSNTTGWGNSFLGSGAGYYNTTGGANSFLGYAAGMYNTIGYNNSFLGSTAGQSNTTGYSNSFLGNGAGRLNTTGAENSFMGSTAGQSNTTGVRNAFLGYAAGYSNTTASDNSFLGNGAGYSNTTGWGNSFLGSGAGYYNTTGDGNSFLGYAAGWSNTTGFNNSFLGNFAGYSNTTGARNAFLGYRAGYSNTTGDENSFLGYDAGYSNTTGWGNIFLGYAAGRSNITASGNSFLGYLAGYSNTTGDANSFLGFYAGYSNTTGGGNSFLGNYAGKSNTTGFNNSFLGNFAGYSNTTGARNSFLGNLAGYSNTTGNDNFFLGSQAGQFNTTGYNNSFLGSMAGQLNTTGSDNTFLGAGAGQLNTTGNANSFLGGGAGSYNTTGAENTFLGSWAGYPNTTGWGNSFLGSQAGRFNTTGWGNSFMGSQAGYYNQSGAGNAVLGYRAGGYGAGAVNSFSSSTIMGYLAGYNVTTGNDNIFLGWQAGYNATTGAGNIIIGYNKDTSAPAANNELNIGGVLYGDLSAKTIGISTRAPQAALDIVSTGTAVNIYAQIWRNGAGDIVSSMSAAGVLMADRFVGDGSGITGLPGGDSLGSHIATMTLTMNTFDIDNVGSITANAAITAYSSVTVAGKDAVSGFSLVLSSGIDMANGTVNARQVIAGGAGNNYFAGNVGIGTTGPGAKLDVKASAAGEFIRGINTAGARIFSIDQGSAFNAGKLVVYNSGGGAQYTLSADNGIALLDGKVGIGTGFSFNPTNPLEVEGAVSIGTAYAGSVITAPTNGLIVEGNVGIGTTGPGAKLHVSGGDVNTASFKVEGSSYVLLNAGNVGIGTTNPGAQIHVYGPGQSTLTGLTDSGGIGGTLYLQDSNGSLYAGGAIRFGAQQGSFAAIKASITQGGDKTYGNLDFQTRNGIADPSLTSRMFIRDNGNVGIGTTSPGAKLHVSGGDVNTASFKVEGSSYVLLNAGNVGIGTTEPGSRFEVVGGSSTFRGSDSYPMIAGFADAGGNYRMVVSTAGNIGIGTTAPATSLDVKSADDVEAISWRNTSMLLGSLGRSGTGGGPYNSGALKIYKNSILADGISLNGNGNSYINSGNVGIGTASPGYKLTVAGTSANPYPLHLLTTGAPGLGWLSKVDYTTGDLRIFEEGANDRVTFQRGGNVGIGTTGPGYKLDVAGTMNAQEVRVNGVVLNPGTGSNWTVSGSDVYRSGGNVGIGTTNPTAAAGYTVLSLDNATNGGYISFLSNGIERGQINVDASNFNLVANGASVPMVFYTNATEKMRVTSSGNVGIGTAGPGSRFEVVGGSSTFRGSDSYPTIAGFADAGGNYRMMVSTAGNVGIGTTNPGNNLEIVTATNGNGLTVNSTGNIAPAIRLYGSNTHANTRNWMMSLNTGGYGDLGLRQSNAKGGDPWTDGTTRFLVDFYGNAGIGTTSNPQGRLEVRPDADSNYSLWVSSQDATGVMVVNKAGNVGIGTANPTSLLTLNGTSSYALQLSNSGTSKTLLGQAFAANDFITGSAANDFAVRSNGANMLFSTDSGATASLYLKNGGNVGIGTTAPVLNLAVSGIARALPPTSGTTQTGGFGLRAGTGLMNFGFAPSSPFGGWIQNSDATDLGNNYPFSLNPNGGNVGIGTTDPLAKLHVSVSAAGATEALRLQNLGAGGQQSYISFNGVGGGGVTSLYGGPPNTLSGQAGFALKLSDNSGNANNFIVADGESYSNYLAFWTGSSSVATNTEKMRITKDGSVGIGTTGPGSMLTVQTGDVQTRGVGNGFIMKDASNGNCYKLYMSAGVLTTTAVACP